MTIGYACLLDSFVRLVRKSLKSPAFEWSKFSDAIFWRNSDCYTVFILRRKCKRFFAVIFKSTTILSLFHTVGRKDRADFFENCVLILITIKSSPIAR